jgi:hypothetical protein
MKKSLLSVALLALSATGFAQVTLSGTSYTQNFNSLASGLPTGWRVYRMATPTSLGTVATYASSATTSIWADTSCGANNVTSGGFKNYASANTLTEGSACTAQQSSTDRALGIRQVSYNNATNTGTDSGAAFVLVLTNTTGMTGFNMNFKLQSLDTSSPRTTKWTVEYAVGATPTSFTALTTSPASPLLTGNNVFSNTTVTANFGTALDNKSSNVYIRIVTLQQSTGNGNRASTAIDDFNLTWTSTVGINDINNNGETSVAVLGDATSSNVALNCNVAEAGNYTITLHDMAGRNVYTTSAQFVAGINVHNVRNINLPGGLYVATLTNGTTRSVAKVAIH